jgi:hypothetical protein
VHRPKYLLVIGASILTIGIIVAAIPFQLIEWTLPANVFVEEWPLKPLEPKVLSLQVTNSTQPLTAAIISKEMVRIQGTIIDPEGKVLMDSIFTQSRIFDVEPTVPGKYALRIVNEGDLPILLSAFFRESVGKQGPPIEFLINIFAIGFMMAVVGLIVIAIGAYQVFSGRRKKFASS